MNPTGTESDLATRALPTPSPKEMPLLGNIDKLAKGNAGCLYDAILQVSQRDLTVQARHRNTTKDAQ